MPDDLTEAPSHRPWLICGDSTPRDRRNQLRVLAVLLCWAAGSIGVSVLIRRGVLTPGPLAWAVAAVPLLLGFGVLVAYARFLREADELQRLVQLQGLALGFGGTFFTMATWKLLARLGAPPLELDDLGMVMAVFYALGSLLAWRRYR